MVLKGPGSRLDAAMAQRPCRLFEKTGPRVIFSEILSPASAAWMGGRLVLRKSNKHVHVSAVLWSTATGEGACFVPVGTVRPALLSTACLPPHPLGRGEPVRWQIIRQHTSCCDTPMITTWEKHLVAGRGQISCHYTCIKMGTAHRGEVGGASRRLKGAQLELHL